jgi:hypothetical protein
MNHDMTQKGGCLCLLKHRQDYKIDTGIANQVSYVNVNSANQDKRNCNVLYSWITTHCTVPEQSESNVYCVTSCYANHVWNETKPQDLKELTKDRSAFFRDITQRWVVVLYRRSGTTYRSHLQESWSPRKSPRLSQNIGSELPLNAAEYPRRAQISS